MLRNSIKEPMGVTASGRTLVVAMTHEQLICLRSALFDAKMTAAVKAVTASHDKSSGGVRLARAAARDSRDVAAVCDTLEAAVKAWCAAPMPKRAK